MTMLEFIPVLDGSSDPEPITPAEQAELRRKIEAAKAKLSKHYPGKHDQSSHGNWSRGGQWSGGQVIERALQGGFTVKDTNGFVPKKGWTVALSKAVERSVSLDEANPAFVAAYRNEFKELLSQEGRYLGGWKADGKVWLDVVEIIDDRKQAIDAMLDRDQEGIYNLGTGEYLMSTDVSKRQPIGIVMFGADVSDEDVVAALKAL